MAHTRRMAYVAELDTQSSLTNYLFEWLLAMSLVYITIGQCEFTPYIAFFNSITEEKHAFIKNMLAKGLHLSP